MIDGRRESLLQNYSNDRLLFIFEMNYVCIKIYILSSNERKEWLKLNIIKMRIHVIYQRNIIGKFIKNNELLKFQN